MCKEIENNEMRLRELVYTLGTFTEDQIEKGLRPDGKPVMLAPFWSVNRYLEELRELGVLKFVDGRYSTQNAPQLSNR